MINYDIVYITNCPSFYKINLFNKINQINKIFVIFLGYSDVVIIDDDFKEKCNFKYILINDSKLEERNKFESFKRIKNILSNISYKKIVYGGYNYIEFVLLSFIIPKTKNILLTESAGETALSGWRFYLKKIIFKRFSKAIASGKIHVEMIRKMGFKGEAIISKGVGIMEKPLRDKYPRKANLNLPLKYLYVGRLIDIKNVEFIVKVFNELELPLTIVGKGVEEEILKEKANKNITFLGFQDNNSLGAIYSDHDVFILPSLQEPWGLVVEEAVYWGCVLLLSERVGSVNEMLIETNGGVTFNPTDKKSLKEAIQNIDQNFLVYKDNIENFDMKRKDEEQVLAHVNLLNN
ncbi:MULTISPECIES: glycosyltransferase family 4 protein [Empedobacter]|uniref:glycosyltransferase family 4 protein n=1 Tax=Empedobacter TaxID=59734 RepID=UPI00057032FF|nr:MULTISPECIES: glycosyltransferase family 4 protein [Empedobacter]